MVDKPAHFLVHPSLPKHVSTLWSHLKELLAYEMVNGGQISIITRLDRETSGLVLVAKTARSARQLGLAMLHGHIEKTYLALVWGWPEEDHFTVDQPLLRKGTVTPSPIWVKQMVHPDGRSCRTDVTVLRRFEKETSNGTRFSLLECRPLTGRRHQIRVHLQWAGFPIVGDKMYGPDENCYLEFIETGWTERLASQLLLDRQALHASGLRHGHHAWECPLPDELAKFAGQAPADASHCAGSKP